MNKEFRSMSPDTINITFAPAPRTDKVVAYTLQPSNTVDECERGEFITLKPTDYTSEVYTLGGWGVERATFVIECMDVASIVHTNVSRIYGYTSPLENGEITDDTRLFFNRTIRYSAVPQRTPQGLMNCIYMLHDLHILIQPNERANYTLRPSDILRRKLSEVAFGEYLQSVDHRMTNLTSSFADCRPRTARVSDEDPAAYLARLQKTADEHKAPMFADNDEELLSMMESAVSIPSTSRLPFFNLLCTDTNYGVENSITWGELKATFQLDPVTIDLTAKTEVEPGGWDNSVESWMANLIINRVSAAMGRCGIDKASTQGDPNESLVWDTVSFIPTGRVLDQSEELEFDEVEFTGMGILPYPYGESDIHVDLSIDITGWAKVTLSIDGMPPRTFGKPMYASAVSSALITESEGTLIDMADIVGRTLNR